MHTEPLSIESNRFPRLHRWGLAVILLLYLGLALLYDVTVPFFEKPDELKHFAVVQYIQSHGALPVVREGIYRPWDQEGTQPPLYHLLAAAITTGLDLSHFEEPPRNPHYADDRSFVWRQRGNNNLYLHPPGESWRTDPVFLAARLARWLSIVAGAGTILLTFGLARTVFPADVVITGAPRKSETGRFTNLLNALLPLLAAALVMAIPQFLHVNSAITNDSLSATLAAVALLLLALIVKNGSSTRYAVLLGLVLGLGAITKLSLLYLLPLTALVLLLDFARHRLMGRLLAGGSLIGALVLLLSGWWFWRNWQLYGDPSALSAHLLYRGGPLDPTPTLAEIWRTEMVGLELSFWAAFGAGQILLEPWLYQALSWFKYLLLLSLGVGVWQWWRQRPPRAVAINVGLLGLWVVIIFGALLRWMQITPASWGRLLYPALPALAVLAAWGLSQVAGLGLRLTGTRFPAGRWLWVALPWLPVAALVTLAAIGPGRYLHPAYAKPPLIAASDIPPDVQRLDLTFEGGLRLLGYRVEAEQVQPGDWLPVTLYWQAAAPIGQNYSAFVHVLDQAGQSVAQANSYPAGGNWPTSMLPPGLVLADTMHVFIPPAAPVPLATRLAFGIFEFDDPQRAAKAAVDAAGQPVEPIFDGPPLVPARWPPLEPEQPLAANFGNQLRLTGFDWIDQPVSPGDSVPLTLYWETLAAPGQDLNLFIHLVDPASQTQVAGFDAPPAFPTRFWQPGTTFIDRRTLTFPAEVPPGSYTLRIGWYRLADFARLPLAEGGEALPLVTLTVN